MNTRSSFCIISRPHCNLLFVRLTLGTAVHLWSVQIGFLLSGLPCSTDGSVVEFSPATREARVRFPVSAHLFFFFFFPLSPPFFFVFPPFFLFPLFSLSLSLFFSAFFSVLSPSPLFSLASDDDNWWRVRMSLSTLPSLTELEGLPCFMVVTWAYMCRTLRHLSEEALSCIICTKFKDILSWTSWWEKPGVEWHVGLLTNAMDFG